MDPWTLACITVQTVDGETKRIPTKESNGQTGTCSMVENNHLLFYRAAQSSSLELSVASKEKERAGQDGCSPRASTPTHVIDPASAAPELQPQRHRHRSAFESTYREMQVHLF